MSVVVLNAPSLDLPQEQVKGLTLERPASSVGMLPSSTDVAQQLVAQLANAEGDQRQAIEDVLVANSETTLPAVLAGLQHDSLSIRSRCAFVAIRMGRSVAGEPLVDLERLMGNESPKLTTALALIADQWGGSLQAA